MEDLVIQNNGCKSVLQPGRFAVTVPNSLKDMSSIQASLG